MKSCLMGRADASVYNDCIYDILHSANAHLLVAHSLVLAFRKALPLLTLAALFSILSLCATPLSALAAALFFCALLLAPRFNAEGLILRIQNLVRHDIRAGMVARRRPHKYAPSSHEVLIWPGARIHCYS